MQWRLWAYFPNVNLSLALDWNHHVPGPSGGTYQSRLSPWQKEHPDGDTWGSQLPLPSRAMGTEPESDNTVSGSETFTNPNHVTAQVKHGITAITSSSSGLQWPGSISSSGSCLRGLERMPIQIPSLQKVPACLEQRGRVEIKRVLCEEPEHTPWLANS